MRFRGVCWGGWVDEATTHEEKGENRRGESKKKKKSRVLDTNSTCLLVFSGSKSYGGHMTTVLAGEISKTKGL